MAEMKLELKTAKLALKVSRSSLTKANTEFNMACQELDKNKEAQKTKKIRLAATLIECLEVLNTWIRKMKEAKDVTIETIIGLPEDAEISKPKDELISDLEAEHDKYIKNVKDTKTGYEELVVRAEGLLDPQVESTSQPVAVTTTATGRAEMFKPQENQKPNYSNKAASHLEVRSFCSILDVYIHTGF